MGEAASEHNVGVMYCCAPPSVHMNGVAVPAAYMVRASPDYIWLAGNPLRVYPSLTSPLPTVQWAIGPDSAFHWLGLGLLPYKDSVITNSSSQPKGGNWTHDINQQPYFKAYNERNAATHLLMSLLSMAAVTFSDPVGETNRSLVMQLCRADGVLLKPDRPATAVDAQFQAMLFGSWPGDESHLGQSKCHTDAVATTISGAVQLTDAEIRDRAEVLFPLGQGGLSSGRRKSLAVSAALVEQIEERKSAISQCDKSSSSSSSTERSSGYGSPQSPMGELYSTHATVNGMTWRYVVGMQVAKPFRLSLRALGIVGAAEYVSYSYDESRLWRLRSFDDVNVVSTQDGGLLVSASPHERCVVSTEWNVTTECFGFELQAIAPIAFNGWVMLGEADKMLPISNQRFASVTAIASGGFRVALTGKPGEVVTIGAINMGDRHGGRHPPPVYATTTIARSGSSLLTINNQASK